MSTKSKQAEAKEAQGYTTAVKNCGNCAHMTCELALPAWMANTNADAISRGWIPEYTVERHGVEKNTSCGIGGFAIKKTATCTQHAPKATGEKS